MKNTTKNKKSQLKQTIPAHIKALYNQEAYYRDILDIPRKPEYFKRAVDGLLPKEESIKANCEFFNLLRRLIDEAPLLPALLCRKSRYSLFALQTRTAEKPRGSIKRGTI